jgi:tetratricopeptide (TPR) repeat protein
LTASASVDLELIRASALLESDPAAAARRAGEILAGSPDRTEAKLLLAAACRRLSDPAAAVAVLEPLMGACSDSALIQLELGRAYAAADRRSEALAAFRRAVECDEGLADAWRELAAQLIAAGHISQGDAAYARYSRLSPHPPALSDATVALADNRLPAAEAMLRRHLEQAPDDSVALRMLASVASRREDYLAAERYLRRCLELAPGYAAARHDLARSLYNQQRNAEVLPLLERLLAAEPHNLDYLSLKAQTLRLIGRIDEGLALLEQAVAEHPHDDRVWLLYGHLLREVAQQSRAIGAYRRALALRPSCGRAYSSLADLKTLRFTPSDRAAMQEQLARSEVRGADRINLEFALGKALEDEGEFAASFEHYALGNALQRATIFYDPEVTTAELQRSKRIQTAAFFRERLGWGSSRADPIFIIGMPRSGSTLLEQILASHSQVEGTRELPDIPMMALELASSASPSGSSGYPEQVAALTRAELEELAARYLTRTQVHRQLGKPRFIDKMLGNFAHIGLIHLMFPHAAIIDARRHPLGCGFSCYRQLFARAINFSYDLQELGRYYRYYAELMDHFDAVLPGRVYRVYYEQLVADPEGELRRLLDHCGLPFEERCLRFYENPRAVGTLSSEQVRQPIYAESVDQWRHYEAWLGPLKEAVGDLVDRYPTPRA